MEALARGPAAVAVHRFARVREAVIAPLAAEFPEARFRLDGSRLVGLGYYSGLCMHLWARDREGVAFPLGDGGMTHWTSALLADGKGAILRQRDRDRAHRNALPGRWIGLGLSTGRGGLPEDELATSPPHGRMKLMYSTSRS